MKKKVLFLILLSCLICFIITIFGFEIYYSKNAFTSYNYAQEMGVILLDPFINDIIQHIVLCILSGLSLCGCIAILFMVLKSDISFIKNSVAEKLKATRAQREEERAQRNEERKAAKIAALEEELDRLKKDGE